MLYGQTIWLSLPRVIFSKGLCTDLPTHSLTLFRKPFRLLCPNHPSVYPVSSSEHVKKQSHFPFLGAICQNTVSSSIIVRMTQRPVFSFDSNLKPWLWTKSLHYLCRCRKLKRAGSFTIQFLLKYMTRVSNAYFSTFCDKKLLLPYSHANLFPGGIAG